MATLRSTGLLGGQKAEAFERLAKLAARFVSAPMAMATLLDDAHLHTLARVGPSNLAKSARTPVKETFCRHVVAAGEPLIVDDAREHELTKGLASVKSGKALAYAGIPLALPGGLVLGTLCVVDDKPRAWKRDEIAVLEDLAESATARCRSWTATRRRARSARSALSTALPEENGSK